MIEPITVGGRRIGYGSPAFLIAEAGINHNGDVDLALRMIDAAAAAGADAVKFQTFTAAGFISRSNPYFDLFKRCELSRDEFATLARRARERNIMFLSTPLDEDSVDLLDDLGVPAFKIASCDVTHIPLLRHVGAKRKSVLLSTGTATLTETMIAVDTLMDAGAAGVAVFHCVSNYPAEPASVNLRAIPRMAEALGRPVGFSDHTIGIEVPLAAVAIGASMIEKHFTLDKDMEGPDHKLSADPEEFKRMAAAIRTVEQALGNDQKAPVESAEMIGILRRSLVAKRAIAEGTVIARDMVTAKRPGTGIPPAQLELVIGRRAVTDFSEDELLDWRRLA